MLSIATETQTTFAPKEMRRPWTFPAHEFETGTGFIGISGNWNIPGGYNDTELAVLLMDTHFEGMPLFSTKTYSLSIEQASNLLDQFKALNPALEDIDADRSETFDIFNIIMGVLSGFNADDIGFFVERDRKKRNAEITELDFKVMRSQEKTRTAQLSDQAGAPIHWVPSPNTFENIRKQVQQRDLSAQPS